MTARRSGVVQTLQLKKNGGAKLVYAKIKVYLPQE